MNQCTSSSSWPPFNFNLLTKHKICLAPVIRFAAFSILGFQMLFYKADIKTLIYIMIPSVRVETLSILGFQEKA